MRILAFLALTAATPGLAQDFPLTLTHSFGTISIALLGGQTITTRSK